MILQLLKEPYIQAVLILTILGVLTLWNYAHKKEKEEKAHLINRDVEIGNDSILGKREKQDDSFATTQTSYGILAVIADGIGGLNNGKLASTLAVKTVIEEFEKGDISANPEYFFQTAARKANQVILNTFEDIPTGTTLLMAAIIRNILYFASAGDSMLGVYREGKFFILNTKQNFGHWLEHKYQKGEISREEALSIPGKRKLVEYIGHDGFQNITVEERPILLKKGDRILLYTDGVESLTQMEIEDYLSMNSHPDEVVHHMMNAVMGKRIPYQDNATAILIDIG